MPANTLPILNTEQYDEYKAFFDTGIDALEERLIKTKEHSWRSAKSSDTLTAVLLQVAKQLSAFLAATTHLLIHSDNVSNGKMDRLEKTWPTATISELRIACHRYSLAVLRITAAMERRSTQADPTEVSFAAEDHGIVNKSCADFEIGSCAILSDSDRATSEAMRWTDAGSLRLIQPTQAD